MTREIRQGEVWWATLDPVVGSEQAKTRPVLVVSVDQINRAARELSIVCPVTTTPHDAAVRIELAKPDGGIRVGYIEPYQIRTISQKRLVDRIGVAPPEVAREVATRIAVFTRVR